SKKKELARFNTEPEVTPIIETPIVTYQSGRPPAPPAPQVPVEVPDDQILKDKKIEFLKFDGIREAESMSSDSGDSGIREGRIYGNPTQAPSIIYIVEPTVANKTNKKALIYVNFLVDKRGTVEEATIDRVLLFDNRGNPTIEVENLDDRVHSAVIKAAMQWQFHPAKENGKPVRALTLHTFTVDY